ncbi:hypothetical protein THAOC_22875, partial [Thalassiosira oceanica]
NASRSALTSLLSEVGNGSGNTLRPLETFGTISIQAENCTSRQKWYEKSPYAQPAQAGGVTISVSGGVTISDIRASMTSCHIPSEVQGNVNKEKTTLGFEIENQSHLPSNYDTIPTG